MSATGAAARAEMSNDGHKKRGPDRSDPAPVPSTTAYSSELSSSSSSSSEPMNFSLAV